MARVAVLALLAAAVSGASAFSPSSTGMVWLRPSSARVAAVPALRMQGFGTPPPAKKVSEVAKDRKRVYTP